MHYVYMQYTYISYGTELCMTLLCIMPFLPYGLLDVNFIVVNEDKTLNIFFCQFTIGPNCKTCPIMPYLHTYLPYLLMECFLLCHIYLLTYHTYLWGPIMPYLLTYHTYSWSVLHYDILTYLLTHSLTYLSYLLMGYFELPL